LKKVRTGLTRERNTEEEEKIFKKGNEAGHGTGTGKKTKIILQTGEKGGQGKEFSRKRDWPLLEAP